MYQLLWNDELLVVKLATRRVALDLNLDATAHLTLAKLLRQAVALTEELQQGVIHSAR